MVLQILENAEFPYVLSCGLQLSQIYFVALGYFCWCFVWFFCYFFKPIYFSISLIVMRCSTPISYAIKIIFSLIKRGLKSNIFLVNYLKKLFWFVLVFVSSWVEISNIKIHIIIKIIFNKHTLQAQLPCYVSVQKT